MKLTSVVTLVLFAGAGITIGVLLQVALAQSGQPGVRPPLTLAVVLAAMGVIDILLAWPVRRAAKGTKRARVDPFFATRVVVLAKASSITGAVLAGSAIGFIAYLLTRTVPPVGSIGFSTAMLVGACVLMIGGLIAEQMCKLPPDEGEENHEETPAEA